ncbi:DUF3221 domain-containing protein [Paenibacillus sp. FSL H7-0331]|uniref:DUF3221 domain-containing protein n=1 Tax=Paenibacillus sp. FSL H7-0331 TaxID=1920421 RepID=UPI00096D406D|nr:DUF3221 domain-containing protein [Paenibacillus sp. FSL H7-0331]OMF07422.1 hypothetical protein BK127_29325 [Paenibacillus sp. FSL H7-0331]
MKYVMLVATIFLCMTGCSTNNPNDGNPKVWDYREGYVIAKEYHKYLVVRNTNSAEIKNKTVSQLLKEAQPDAIWITVHTDNDSIHIGDKVSISIDGGIDQSYPAQASAKDFKKL